MSEASDYLNRQADEIEAIGQEHSRTKEDRRDYQLAAAILRAVATALELEREAA